MAMDFEKVKRKPSSYDVKCKDLHDEISINGTGKALCLWMKQTLQKILTSSNTVSAALDPKWDFSLMAAVGDTELNCFA